MRRRLLFVTLATTSLVLVAFALPLGLLVRNVAEDRAVTAAERDSAALAPILAITLDRDQVAAAMARTGTGSDRRLTVWLPDGTQLGDPLPGDEAVDLARERRTAFTRRADGALELYSPVVTADDAVSVVRARVPDRLLAAGVTRSWLALGAVAAFLVAVAAVIADRLARHLTGDASELARTASALADGDAAARAPISETPELAEAARALNLLADRIDELRSAERERVADLSHRLRTPLTVLRLDAEAAGAEVIIADVERLERAVSELVRAARRPLHESLVPARSDLVAIVADRAGFWGALADDDGRAWVVVLPESGPVPVALAEAEVVAVVDALVANVFAHTPPGVGYRVSLETTDTRSTLVVEDDGPGIDAPDRAVQRGVAGGVSTGLGLDIVRRTAESVGGGLELGPAEGGGARVAWWAPRPA